MSTYPTHTTASAEDALLPVYLVHYDAPDWLSSAVETIVRSDREVDVWVLDNGPPGALAPLGPGLHVERMPRNLGYAGAANVALRRWLSGTAPFCVIGSHDLHVEPDCFSKLLAAANASPEFGILAPHVPTNFRHETVETLGDIEVTTMVSGTCMLLRRECMTEIGLFDAGFHSYCEDNELCARASRHGWKVGTVTNAQARGLGTRDGRRREMSKQKNRLLLAWRVGGARAVAVEYGRLLRVLAYAVLRKPRTLPGALAALTVGSFRLVRGMATNPARP